MSNLNKELLERSGHQCELCQSKDSLSVYEVSPPRSGKEFALVVCKICLAQILNSSSLDPKHWYGLKEAIWSEVPAVQVTAWRILKQLPDQDWAQDLLSQMYLDEELQAWAEAGLSDGDVPSSDQVITRDSNGTQLSEGDTVTLIKDLDVKGGGFTAKRGTTVKNIRLTQNPEQIEGRVNGVQIVLLTKYLKKG